VPTWSRPSTSCRPTLWRRSSSPAGRWQPRLLDPSTDRRAIFIATDTPDAGDRIAGLVGDLGLAAVQLGRVGQGGLLIEAPNALVLRNLIEQPL
jgi:hypothetical protein